MKKSSEKIIVTAALPYANGDIHIGHLLEYIQADVYTRFLKMIGKEALYICASDMHGTPIEINAQKAGMPPEKFVEKYWREHQEDFKSFLIQFDNYYKTHSKENRELSEFFYAELKKKKLIYRKKIQAIYCEHCERYLPDRFVKGICPKCHAPDQYGDVCEKCSTILKGADLVNPYCVMCKNKPVTKPSEHYFFSLSSFSKQLQQWINSKEADIQPEMKHWLQEWLMNGLEDWCVSRDAPYFGFEIPESKKETGETKYFYVWLDAPIGYISSTKNYTDKTKQKWEDYWYEGQVQHFIGKDIAYFHFLFWPAMLMAVGVPLPKLTVHGFVTVNGQKMSKSRGTFFTAKDFLKLYPAEALRFYYANHLDRKVVDVDLNFEEFKAFNNNVLVGGLGNFCYRVITFAQKNYGEVASIAPEAELSLKVKTLMEATAKYYAAQDFKTAVKTILQIADIGNSYFQQAEPWKNKTDAQTIAIVGWCVNLARNLGILVQPILPTLSSKVYTALGEQELSWKDISFTWKGKIHEMEMVAQKIETVPQTNTFPLHLAVGKVIEVKDHPNADSLFIFKVDFGKYGQKQVVTALKKVLPKEAFLNKKIVFCLNLKPAKFRGELSEALILAAEEGTKIVPLEMRKSALGSEVVPEGMTSSTVQITIEEMGKVQMTVMNGKVMVDGKALRSAEEEVVVNGMKDGAKVR